MSFKLTKTLMLGSFFALGAIGFSACGGDSSSGSGSDEPDHVVIPTQKDANILVTGLDSRAAGDTMRFKGNFNLDFVDSTNENSSKVQFTGMSYQVAQGTDINNLIPIEVAVLSSPTLQFPTANGIDLNSQYSAFVRLDLNSAGFNNQCGMYSLIVTVTASDDPVNAPAKFSRTEVISFEREAAEFCREVTPSSSSADDNPVQEIVMTPCEVQLSTGTGKGVSLATCEAVDEAAADLIFSKTGNTRESDVKVDCAAGSFITPIINGDLPPFDDDFDADNWPETMLSRSAYVSDFKFTSIAGTTVENMIENSSQIYVVKTAAYNAETGAGFYPFAIIDETEINNGERTLTLKIYKVQ